LIDAGLVAPANSLGTVIKIAARENEGRLSGPAIRAEGNARSNDRQVANHSITAGAARPSEPSRPTHPLKMNIRRRRPMASAVA
jgi:hypothetical protein